jgi:hypothetical protein
MTTKEYSKTYRYAADEVAEPIKLDIPEGYEVYDVHTDNQYLEDEGAKYIYFTVKKKTQ